MPVIEGIVHVVTPTQEFGQKGFRKRDVVLEQDAGRFTNYIPIEFTGEACDAVSDLGPGDEVKIEYELGGRKWQKDEHSEVKYFLSARAIRHRVLKRNSFNDAPESVQAVPDEDIPF